MWSARRVCNYGAHRRIPATVAPVSPRTRVTVVVVVIAAVAAGSVAAIAGFQSSGHKSAAVGQRKGLPPLELDLGVRNDPAAVALRRASTLYANGNASGAAADLRP